jgi:HlyD family secretion protein
VAQLGDQLDIPRPKKRSGRRYVLGGLVVIAFVVAVVGISRLRPAAPSVDASRLYIDTVKQGTMLREVSGPGTLVPENILWISAVTGGRVEAIHVEPGSQVESGTRLLELSNPDVQLALLDAQRQLTAAQAELVNLRSTLKSQQLSQRGVVAQLTIQQRQAIRNSRTAKELAESELIAPNQLKNTEDSAAELRTLLEVEQERLRVIDEHLDAQLNAQRAQVQRLRSIVGFRERELQALHVTASTAGMVQDLSLQIGQWVMQGTLLTRIVQPARLKAVLRIPENQAPEVRLGQVVAIDTRNGIVRGHVSRIDPAAQAGAVTVDVQLKGELPPGARPDLSVDGTIELERLYDVLHVGRPAYGQPNSTLALFKLVDQGRAAVRVPVQLGRTSLNTIEIVSGLKKDDIVILSDLARGDSVDRVRLRY